MKKHLKRLAAPKSWVIRRKLGAFITKLSPGAHQKDLGMPLSVVLKDMMQVCHTTKEIKQALHIKQVLVNQKRVKNHKLPVGLMDTVHIPDDKKSVRVTLDEKGFIRVTKIDDKESKIKITKIAGKTTLAKNKTQLNCSDARNIMVDKDVYKTSDSLVIELPSQKIKEHLKFETGNRILLTGGKHKGQQGKLIDINKNNIIYQTKTGKFTTLKKYAFIIGKEKALVTL